MIAVKFDDVSKRYRLRGQPAASAGTRTSGRCATSRSRWRRAKRSGIIGHNGAGKSTILKLLSRITAPSRGTITLNGRLAALIEVGSGFHPELTGRENIFLSGSVLGMRRAEIAEKLDRIVEFSGVGPFIDEPVKRYSSGMFVRLGFSVAAHLEPDILLVDEVLAVGDAAFQVQCYERIGELRRNGTTLLFISHDLSSIDRLCDRVVLMNHGRLVGAGTPAEVLEQYQQLVTDSFAADTADAAPAVAGPERRGCSTCGSWTRRAPRCSAPAPAARSGPSSTSTSRPRCTTPSSRSSTTRATAGRSIASRAPPSRTRPSP